MSKQLPKTVELTDEEMDWLDNGNGFCALDNLPKKDYDEISYAVTLKIRESYNQAELKNKDRYVLPLTEEEIDCIFDIMVEMLIEIEFQEKVLKVKDLTPALREEYLNDFKETLALTNGIFEKMGKPLQTIETLEKRLKLLNPSEDKK